MRPMLKAVRGVSGTFILAISAASSASVWTALAAAKIAPTVAAGRLAPDAIAARSQRRMHHTAQPHALENDGGAHRRSERGPPRHACRAGRPTLLRRCWRPARYRPAAPAVLSASRRATAARLLLSNCRRCPGPKIRPACVVVAHGQVGRSRKDGVRVCADQQRRRTDDARVYAPYTLYRLSCDTSPASAGETRVSTQLARTASAPVGAGICCTSTASSDDALGLVQPGGGGQHLRICSKVSDHRCASES